MIRLFIVGCCLSACPWAVAQNAWFSTGSAGWQILQKESQVVSLRATAPASPGHPDAIYLVEVAPKAADRLAALLHSKLKHCGGFMFHSDEEAGRQALFRRQDDFGQRTAPQYTISQEAVVKPALARMEEARLAETIASLAGFGNRYYSTVQGAQASHWLRKTWEEMGKAHGGILVEQYAHPGVGQQSVIATILGSDRAEQVLVVGAHLDSINLFAPRSSAAAPGADDDASGVAGLTELLRTIVAGNYKPRRTIKLIAYAAEEVGLRGSQDIARAFRKANIEVVGVLQLDMTNYKGSAKDIYLISDYTDASQNEFLRKLIATYLPDVTVGSDECGYACSDHAAWNAEGYAASMPFESALGEDNPHIHTKDDTYAMSGKQAAHALKFARLAAAFAIELGSGP